MVIRLSQSETENSNVIDKLAKRHKGHFSWHNSGLWRGVSSVLVLVLLLPAASVASQSLNSSSQLTCREVVDNAAPPTVTVSQTPPSGSVASYQPVLVFAQVTGQASQLTISLKIQISCSSNNTGLITFSQPSITLTPSYPLIPYPGGKGWYFAAIPGLPAETITVARPCVRYPPICHVGVTLSSSVSYTISVDGAASASGSYTVQQQTYAPPNMPPIVGAFVENDIYDSATMSETYGLSPSGWIAGPSNPIPILAFAFNPNGVQSLNEYYSVTNGSYTELASTEDQIQAAIDGMVASVDDMITYVNTAAGSSFRSLTKPISVQDAVIPPNALGNYIAFHAVSTDMGGNSYTSPEGFYYIVNTQASKKVLIVDPHVKLWLLLQNLNRYASLARSDSAYQLPPDLLSDQVLLLKVSQLLKSFESAQFHYWNLLGESYNISIAYPDSNVSTLLQTFQPNVIYLSDLSLGYKPKQGTASQFFDWDLSDLQDSNGSTILSDLISYTQQHHCGLIGSAGVLSDWEIGCPPDQTKVGSRGDIGDQISDANPVNESTLAPMFGMPLLPVFEYARDRAAQGSGPACQAIGSIPLLVPDIPWDGTLLGPSSLSSSIMNKNPSIMANLPPELNIVMPSYQQLGYNAANTVGWQLSLPAVLAHVAWNAASKAHSSLQVQQSEMNLASLSHNITGAIGSGSWSSLDCALNQGLAGFYRSFAGSRINGTGVDLSVSIPCAGSWSGFVRLPISQMASLWPVQIAALSPDYAAGIVTYDKYFSSNGYRSVYFSFPVEASDQRQAATIISNAVAWVLA